jgi:hypothetical protein
LGFLKPRLLTARLSSVQNKCLTAYYAQWLEEQRLVVAQKQQPKQVALADNTIVCLESDGSARYLC